ncbi:MAG: type II toxin-antitoxin system VapC family toxin [Hyphomicrobium aestuarii]|nr:type II toxin-antitoxin system VapC family toxin [Hyphomicrobium aestuarii]
MNVLLDTHIALWAVEDNSRLSRAARDVILDPTVDLFVGIVSLWEIAIKHALQRGTEAMPMSAADALQYFQIAGFDILPVTTSHIVTLEELPRHHDDPFDRMLVAMALSEPYRLLTHHKRLGAYGNTVMVV